MIDISCVETRGWEAAIRGMRAKGYRRTKNGRYEAFTSNHCKTVGLGTYNTIEEAREAVFEYRMNRFISGVREYGLDPDDGVVYEENYVAFENGMIFNLHGERMHGGIGRGGYRHGIFNGHNRDHHKIIAECFIPNPDDLRDVNHRNGDKLDLRIENLERTTHADNILHSYRNGLQTKVTNRYGTFKVLNSDDLHVISSLHSKGLLDREIAEKVGCSRELVSRKIREMGIR